ncbi:MAG: hypothetical protein COV72_00930 [Candidatus Omnitrophica bacterium CG11_big_fil_rev_8_21_14_0_20_42_13]|uniref:histidine kinase n=1 Tax=Candidatus Ghiorseimicrobium undicola TaxID=1974746 RepID=A0A2H0LZR9_9BACT|nr:MAG: hypothetical protein COV72_00930 [Candidatus Omnitrophica bacterium CG11_big_fil_rev_8_21_14_0_20_42_13]
MPEHIFDFSNYQYNYHALPVIIVSLLIFSIALFIFFQVKKVTKNTAFFLLCFSLSVWLFGTGIVYLANNPRSAHIWYKYFTFFGVTNIMPSAYLFAAASSGRLPKQRFLVLLSFILSFGIYLAAVFTDKIIGAPRLYFWGYYPVYKPPSFIFLLLYAASFAAVQLNLWLGYKKETVPIKKTQIRTIIIGFFIGFLASADFIAKIFPVPLYPFGFLPIFIFTCLLAYSIIRYRAFDIETVIHKTAGWILASSTAFIPIMLLAYWLKPWYSTAPALNVALLCGGVFYLLTVYVQYTQPKIDHIFQRRKYNLEEISAKFIEDLVHLKGLNQLIARIEDVLKNTLYPRHTDIFIYHENKKKYALINWNNSIEIEEGKFLKWLLEKNKIAYRDFIPIDPEYAQILKDAEDYFNSTSSNVVVPLVLNERLLGFINLDKKINLKRYTAADFSFLNTLKNQSAIAISNSLVYENIEEQVRKRTEQLVDVQKQLIQAEKLATVGTLAGGVAHEINNPLTAILTNVQMLLMDNAIDSALDRESLELIEEATKRCRTIVSKLMAYARKPLESAEVADVDLPQVLRNVLLFLEYQFGQENIKISSNADSGERFIVKGNHNEFEQVFTNLIINARDAIRKIKTSGVIEVVFSKTKNRVKIEIKDEGVGIEKELCAKIFDPFFTTKDVGKGLGLGLSICQAIVEKYSGTISVDSRLNQGTVFTIRFPESRHEEAAVKT